MVKMIMGTRGLYKLGDYIYKDGKIFRYDYAKTHVDVLRYPDVPCKEITEKELDRLTQAALKEQLEKLARNSLCGAFSTK